MQKSTSTSVIPWSSALHIGVEPIHKERSESAVADSFAEIVEPSAFEVCEAAAAVVDGGGRGRRRLHRLNRVGQGIWIIQIDKARHRLGNTRERIYRG